MEAWDFNGRVASMRQGDDMRGYLFVTVAEPTAHEPRPQVLLEFLRSSDTNEDTWFYSDRADPTDYDTAAELSSLEIDWYGTRYSARWLSDDEATDIKKYFEGQEPVSKKIMNSILNRKNRPHVRVLPDYGK
ncbi:hypothetical protein [Amycolatopsis jejuensis]|uniref:hypothetical protein n=1 Tax=Amycolatopsis jejuensis TaxID=330084 RepID=UPI0012E0A6CB|nr:hypothetical protein [Amycolatopsis jejuensis]